MFLHAPLFVTWIQIKDLRKVKIGFILLPILMITALGLIATGGYYYKTRDKLPLYKVQIYEAQNVTPSTKISMPPKPPSPKPKAASPTKSPTPSPTSAPSINNDPVTDQANCGDSSVNSDFTPPSGKPQSNNCFLLH